MSYDTVAKYVGGYYRQHNPQALDGADAFIVFVQGFTLAFPDLHANIKRSIAGGDLVVVHCHITRNASDRGLAV
jgi:predicted SnoaL-like aldol condensation-catalyzing enzyme